MPSFKIAAVVASIFSLAAALPHHKSKSTQEGFKITQVANKHFSGRHGASHYAQAASKFGFNLPVRNVAVTDADNSTGTSAPANPVIQGGAILEYLTPVTIGSQEVQLDFDTGSSDLWVAGPTQSDQASDTYTPTGSAEPGETWSIQYGDGSSASGEVYTDTVTIGTFGVQNQAVEVAEQVSGQFFTGGGDGLLGLAFSSINTVQPEPVKTWFDNAVAQGLPNVFAADLSASGPGAYDFGMVDNSAFSGDLTFVDVDSSEGFWMFTPDDGEAGIADTGTTLILLSDEGTDAYYQGTGATIDQQAGGYIFDCGTTLPDFTLTINGYKATVPGDLINFAENGDGTCFGGIQSVGSNPFAIYGDVFLKTQYTVFDQRSGSPQLGFAPKAGA